MLLKQAIEVQDEFQDDVDGLGLTIDADIDEALTLSRKGKTEAALDRLHTARMRALDLASLIHGYQDRLAADTGKENYKPQNLV